MVALLRHDVWLSMPPLPFEYQGREPVRQFLQAVMVLQSPRRRLVPTRANGQPAFGVYIRDPRAEVFHGIGLLVLSLAGSQISALTHFGRSVLTPFGLPRTLPE